MNIQVSKQAAKYLNRLDAAAQRRRIIMSPVTAQAATIFDLLPEHSQQIVLALLHQLLPDDIAAPADVSDIEQARLEYLAGETVDFGNIEWK